MFELDLERVIVREGRGDDGGDVVEALVGAAREEGADGGQALGEFGLGDGPGLVQVAEHGEVVGAVADVGHVEERVPEQGSLQGEVPVLDVAPGGVAVHVEDDVRAGVGGVALFARAEAVDEGVGDAEVAELGWAVQRRETRDERGVGAEILGRGHAVPVVPAEAVAAAEDRFGVELIGGAEAGGEVVPGLALEGAVFDAAAGGDHQLVLRGVEVGEVVVGVVGRGGHLIAEAQVEGEPGVDLEVVLQVEPVGLLADLSLDLRGELVGAAGAEVKVGEGVDGVGVGPGEGAEVLSGQAGVEAAVAVDAVERVGVVDDDGHAQQFVAHLEVVAIADLRQVEARIEGGGELGLRVGGLAAEAGEALDVLGGDAALDAGPFGQAGDAEQFAHGRAADERRQAVHAETGDGEAVFEHFGGRLGPGEAGDALLVEGIEIAEIVAAGKAGDEAGGLDVLPAMGVAEEGVQIGREGVVDFDGALVVGEAVLIEVAEVGADAEGAAAFAVGLGQFGEHAAGEGRHGNGGAGGEDGAGGDGAALVIAEAVGGADVEREDTGAHGGGGHGGESEGGDGPAGAFVVGKEEGTILHDRTADGNAELVALVDGLPVEGGLEEAGGVELLVLEELPEGAVQGVGAGLGGDVHDGAAGAAELGGVGVDDEPELGDGVGRGLDGLIREALVGGAVEVVVDAVEQEVVPDRAEAVDVIGAFAAEGDGALIAGLRLANAGGEQGEIGVGAALEREFDHLAGGDDLALRGTVGLKQRGGGFDGDRFADGADAEREIDALAGVDGEDDVLDGGDGEAGFFGGDFVGADAGGGEDVVAGFAGFRGEGQAGLVVPESDLGGGDGAALFVADGADDGGRVELGGERGQQQDTEQRRAAQRGQRFNAEKIFCHSVYRQDDRPSSSGR